MTDASRALFGIFVGGGSTRMGGRPKGLLRAPDTDEPIVEKLARIAREAGMTPILVGDREPYGALAKALGLDVVADDPAIDGPLGGLAAALDRAGARPLVAVACDMPHVSRDALEGLVAHAPDAPLVAPRRGPDGKWEPLFARYDAARLLPVLRAAADEGVRSFQALFARIDVAVLPQTEAVARALEDWDTPEDVK